MVIPCVLFQAYSVHASRQKLSWCPTSHQLSTNVMTWSPHTKDPSTKRLLPNLPQINQQCFSTAFTRATSQHPAPGCPYLHVKKWNMCPGNITRKEFRCIELKKAVRNLSVETWKLISWGSSQRGQPWIKEALQPIGHCHLPFEWLSQCLTDGGVAVKGILVLRWM